MYKLNKGISSFSGKRRAILFFAYNFLHLPTADVKMARVLGLTMEINLQFRFQVHETREIDETER